MAFTHLFLLPVVGILVVGSHGTLYFHPEQTHIAIGENPDEMVIVWNTQNSTSEAMVMYGKQGYKLNLTASGQEKAFTDGGSQKRTQYIHTVVLSGLEFDTQFTYIVGSKLGWSNEFSFKTWPQGTNWVPRIALYGDLGNVNAQSLARLQLDADAGLYDAVLHVGDFAYNMDTDNARLGDEFMRQIEPLASKLPYMTSPGNHECAYNFSNYKRRFVMPRDKDYRMFYSFTMGPVRFISLNTEVWYYPQYGTRQIFSEYEWLDETLREANKPENRVKHPWLITLGHRPMYCSNNNTDDCTHHESLVRVGFPVYPHLSWEKLFQKHGVDLAIWAHEHNYERLWPVYNHKVMNGSYSHPYTDPKAPVHIITGSAGCYSRHNYFRKDIPAWSAFRIEDYGYTRMQVANRTHLYLQQVSDDKGGKIVDSVTLIKHSHGSFQTNPDQPRPIGNPYDLLGKNWQPYIGPTMKEARHFYEQL